MAALNVGDVGNTIALAALKGGSADSWSAAVVQCYYKKPSGAVGTLTGNYAVTSQSGALFTYQPTSASVLDESGVWTLQPHVVDGTQDYVCDDIVVTVGPKVGSGTASSITLTSGTAAQINTAIAALSGTARRHGQLRLAAGTYDLETPIVAANYMDVILEHGAVLTSSTLTGGADAATNCLISCAGTAGALDTTMTAYSAEGDTTITLASVTGISDGTWLLLNGNNDTLYTAEQSSGDSDGGNVEYYSLVRAASVNGLIVTLDAPGMPRQHSRSTRVRTWTPVIGFRLLGEGYLLGSATIAVGVHMRGVVDCAIRGSATPITVETFSRYAVNVDYGSLQCDVSRVSCAGECNGIILNDSCTDCSWSEITRDVTGLRTHAAGYPRHDLAMRNRCTRVAGKGAKLGGGSAAVLSSGGSSNRVEDVTVVSYDPTDLLTRWAAVDAGTREYDGGWVGVALNCSLIPTLWKEHSHGIVFANFQVQNCIVPTTGSRASTIDIANVSFSFQSLTISNRGRAEDATCGVRITDASGAIEGYLAEGVSRALWIRGDNSPLVISNCKLLAASGVPGDIATDALYLDCGSALHDSGPTLVENLQIGGYTTAIGKSAEFIDYAMEFRDVYLEGLGHRVIHRVYAAINGGASLAGGTVVTLTTATGFQRAIVAATTGGEAHGVVWRQSGDSGTGVILVQDCNAGAVAVIATAASVLEPGTPLEVDASGGGAYVKEYSAGTIIGYSESHKAAAGSPAYVYMSPRIN